MQYKNSTILVDFSKYIQNYDGWTMSMLQGLALSIPSEDHFMQEIIKVKQISLQWADIAEQVKNKHLISKF